MSLKMAEQLQLLLTFTDASNENKQKKNCLDNLIPVLDDQPWPGVGERQEADTF